MAPPQIRPETMVRAYKSPDAYRKDAERLAKAGWTVTGTTTQQPRSGCARILFLGLFAAIFKPKPLIVATYQRSRVA